MNQSMDSSTPFNSNNLKQSSVSQSLNFTQNSNRINMVHMNQTELKALNSISTSHYGRNDLNYDNLETIKKRVAHGVSTTESTRM